jgi:hypothetical protein
MRLATLVLHVVRMTGLLLRSTCACNDARRRRPPAACSNDSCDDPHASGSLLLGLVALQAGLILYRILSNLLDAA